MIISLVLSTSIIGSIGNFIAQDITDSMDTSLKSEYVKYHDQEIVYQHQMWRIPNQSVCSNFEAYSPAFTKCTVVASQYFSETCRALSETNTTSNNIPQIRSMMCAASVNFKPTIAEISSSKAKSGLEKLEQECNLLIMQASFSDETAIEKQRDNVCAKYNAAAQ